MCVWYFNIQRKALLEKLLQHPVFERQLFCNLRYFAFHSLEVCSYYKTKCVLCTDFCLESLIFHTTGTSISKLKNLSKRVVCSAFLIKSLKNTRSIAKVPLFTVQDRFYIYIGCIVSIPLFLRDSLGYIQLLDNIKIWQILL